MGIFSFLNKNKEKASETFKFGSSPESKGYKLLTNVSEFSKEYQEALNTVRKR